MRPIALPMFVAGLLAAVPSKADVPEVRIAQQFSMGYLQFNVMKHLDLLQKHAAALGIPEVKISYIVFNGPDMMNDALLSGAVDIASGGVPGLLTIWAKTKGTPQEVRGIAAMSQQVVLLTSKDPRIKSIRDFKPGDRIALPAGGDFMNAFTVPPFQNMQLKDPAIHVVLSSEDVVGLLNDPRYKYILTPHAMTKWSDFMFKMGRIKAKPETWKDLFWPEIHGLAGS